MLTRHPHFTNRPASNYTFLPKDFNLNFLRTSGWYALSDKVENSPTNCLLYQLFVVAPNPDIYVTQFAFGVLYKVIVPSITDGDIDIADGEILKDKYNRYVFSNKRATVDYNGDGRIDEDLGSVYIKVGNELYNIVRYTTDEESTDLLNSEHIHISSTDDNLLILPQEEKINVKFTTNTDTVPTADEYSFLNNADILTDNGIVKADSIIPDNPETIIVDRSAIFVRSYLNGTWTDWKLLTGYTGTETSLPILEDELTHQIFNIEDLYNYVDSKLTFADVTATTDLYGLRVEVTGLYNDAPYDIYHNVYGVSASGLEYEEFDDFPAVGNPEILYVSKSENKLYRYDELTESYYCVGADYRELEAIGGTDEGNKADGPLPKN